MAKEKPKLRKLTKAQIMNAKAGDVLYDHDGRRWRITSVNTWVTRPEDREFGLKFGLYDYSRAAYAGGRWDVEMLAGPDTHMEKAVVVRGLPKVGQTVELVKDFREFEGGPNPGPLIPKGTSGLVREVRPMEEQYRQFHGGEKALLKVAWSKHGTSYNVRPSYIRAKGRKAAGKPRLTR